MSFDFERDLVRSLPELQRFARRLARGPAHADDLVQDCVERALRNRDKFAPGTNLEAWLVTIMKNLHYTQHQRERRVCQTELTEDAACTAPAQVWPVMLRETGEAMDRLSPNHRELIRIVVLDGLSYEEAAKALGVSIGTVRSRLSRARTELRNHEARPRTPVRRVDGGQPPEPRSRLSPPEPAMAPEAPVAPEPAMAPEPTTAPAAASRVVAAVPPPSGALAVWRLSSRPVAPRADRLAGTRVVGLRRSAYRQSPGPNAGRRTPLFTERSTGRPCRIGAGSRMAGLPWSRDGPRPRAAP